MKCNIIKMEDALEALIDYRGKTPQKSIEGIMTLSAKSVKNNYIDYSQCYFISEDEYNHFMVRGTPRRLLIRSSWKSCLFAVTNSTDMIIPNSKAAQTLKEQRLSAVQSTSSWAEKKLTRKTLS